MKKFIATFALALFVMGNVFPIQLAQAGMWDSGSSSSSSSSSSTGGMWSGSTTSGEAMWNNGSTSSTSSNTMWSGTSNTSSTTTGMWNNTSTTNSNGSMWDSSNSNCGMWSANCTNSNSGGMWSNNSNTNGGMWSANSNSTCGMWSTDCGNANSNSGMWGTNTNGMWNNTSLPSFSNLSSTLNNSTSATVYWTSSNSSDFRVCYQVQYSYSPTCINVGNATSYTISGLNAGTTYEWWVRGQNTTGSASSQVQYFTTSNSNNGGNSLPNFGTLSSTVNNDGTIRVNYSATDTNNTSISYQVCYKVTSSSAGYTCTNAGNATNFTLSGLAANTGYTWFVKATNNIGTRDSSTYTFTTSGTSNGNNIPHVTLLESRNIQASTATLIWNGYDVDANAPLTYQVCFGTTSSSMTSCTTTTNESITVSNLIAGTTYYWTVRVSDQSVQGITDNGPLSFTTMANNSSNRMPSITLGGVSNTTNNGATVNYSATDPDGNALTVDICVSTDRNNATSNCVYTTSNTGSYTITNLSAGTTYYWTARVSDGIYRVYSTDSVASFTTTGTTTNQAPIARLTDTTNVTTTTARLRWVGTDNESDALTYQVCYSTSLSNLASNCVNYTTPNGASSNPSNPTTLTYDLSGLSTNVTYFWNVQVRDGSHSFAPSINGPFTFVTGTSTTLPSVTLNSIGSPVTTNTVNLSWNGTNAVSYDVYFGTSSSPALYQSAITASQITSPVLTNGTYYWNVVARNANGQTATANNGPNSFTVNLTNGTTNPPVTPVVTQNDTFRFTAYTASVNNNRAKTVFAQNETVRFVMQVANLSTQQQTLTFPDNGDEVQFNVSGAQSFVAHADSTTNTSITLAPGEIRTFTADSSSGTTSLVEGLYTATAQIRANNGNFPTAPQMQFLVSTTQSQTNYAPQVTLLTPANNVVVNGGNVTLTWFGFDPNGDTLTYDVYFDTNSTPTTIVSQGTSAANYQATGLTNGTRYYWRVVARDPQGLTGQSLNGTFNFTSQTNTQNPSTNANFEYRVVTRDGATNNPRTVFVQGQNMVFELQVRNLSQSTQTATINDTARALFRVMNTNNQQVFVSPFTSGNQTITFNPGEVKTYSYTWNQVDTNGNQVSLGNYTVSGDANPVGSNVFPTAASTAFSIVSSNNNPNLAPTVTLLSPADNSVVSSTTTTLTWAGQDPNGNTVNYNVYVSTDSTNLTSTTPIVSNSTTNSYQFSGTNNTRYYWTVRATDGSLPAFAANGPFSFTMNTGGTTNTLGLSGDIFLKSTVTNRDTVNFTRTENVNVQVVLMNSSNISQTVTFPTSQMFDIIIKNNAGQIVWQSSRAQTFSQGQTSIVVPANGQIQLANIIWNRIDNNGQVVTSGSYTAEALVTSNNATITIPAKAFTVDTSTVSNGGGSGGGGGGYSGGGSGGGGGSNVDSTTPTTIPATDNGSFLTVYGPLKFDLSNGVATVPIKHMDAGTGISVQYDKGTVVTTADGSRFTGTIYTPSCYTESRLPATARTSIPNGYTNLYDCFIQYGDLTQTFSPMLRVYGDLSRDITKDVTQPENLAIMFYDPATKVWTKIGGYSDFKGKRFDTYIKKSGVIGFFDTHNTPGTSIPQEPQGTCSAFTDIQFHWAKDVICTLASRGVVSGVTNTLFRPDLNMTRAELVKVVMRLNGKSVSGIDASKAFPDIRGNEWYAPYIAQAKSLGIISGYSDGYFRPNQPVNRAEALKIILRGTSGVLQAKIDQEQVVQSSDSDDYTFFQDVRETDWFSRYVAYSFKRGIVSGKNDGLFHGEQYATRAELAKIALMMYEFPNK